MNDNRSISGLTDAEAQEFHQFYVQGLVGFTAIAVVAHILVWAWRPWFNLCFINKNREISCK